MVQRNQNWDAKIRFFSKFLGYEQDDFQETLDQTNKSELIRRPSKGIKIIQNPPLYQSMMLSTQYVQEVQKKWLNLIRTPYRFSSKSQLLRLTYQGTCYAHKVLPWLAQNRHKINLKLYNLKKIQYRTGLNPSNPYKLEKFGSELQIMHLKIGQNSLSELLGIFMLHRQDIQYSETLLLLGQTVNEYLYDAPVLAFSLLYILCCSGVYLPLLTNQVDTINQIIAQICTNIKANCSSAPFLIRDKIPIEQFVRTMVQCVWLNISEHRTSFRQKILYYLLINQMNVKAVSRVCEAAIVSLSRLLNQGNRQKSLATLSNPQAVMDEEIFLNYLFNDK